MTEDRDLEKAAGDFVIGELGLCNTLGKVAGRQGFIAGANWQKAKPDREIMDLLKALHNFDNRGPWFVPMDNREKLEILSKRAEAILRRYENPELQESQREAGEKPD